MPLIFYTGSSHAVTPCRTTDSGRTVSITNVLDGDTVVISTGEHVRLVGIDTPEMNYDAGRPEPGAVEAREYLQGLLRDETQLTLVQDAESQDRYRRTLGHLFLADGTNVQAALLAGGYAVKLTFPPSLKFLQCYHQLAEAARQDKLGIWKYLEYQAFVAGQSPDLSPGYRIITARVKSITESKYTLTLFLDQNLSLKIQKEDLEYFANMDIKSLVNTLIQVQGELYKQRGQLSMRIRHPVDLKVVSLDN